MHPMETDDRRLDGRGGAMAEIRGHLEYAADCGLHLFRVCPGDIANAQELHRAASRAVAGVARSAVAARYVGQRADWISGGIAGDSGSDVIEDSREFVAHDSAGRHLETVLHRMQIRPANAAIFHPHDDFAFARNGIGHLGDFQRLAHRAEHAGFHDDRDIWRGCQLLVLRNPGKLGWRFSWSAATPSAKSALKKLIISIASDASKAGPATRSQLLSERLVNRTACCGPRASLCATSIALSSSLSAGTQRLTSPIRSSSLPSIKSAVIR